MEAAERMAHFISGTGYDDLPHKVREAAKRIMLDTIGCALGAVNTNLGQAALRVAQEQGGFPQAAILGSPVRTSTLLAAYANARLANVLDFDETFVMQGHHAHCALAGALAACESAQLGGRELITAFAVGFETGARIGRYVSGDPLLVDGDRAVRWRGLVGPVQGVFAAAAAAACALQLSAGQVRHVLGMCGHYLAPRVDQWQTLPELPTIKYNDSGWAAHGGLMAVLNARAGVTGLPDPFSGDLPLWRVIRDQGGDLAALTEPQAEWLLPNTSFKPWPSCRWIHYSLTALHDLVLRENLRADEVESITLLTFPQACATACFHDAEVGENLVQASFSYPHSAAMLLLRVPPGPEWFSPAAMQGEAATRIRRLVRLAVDPASLQAAGWGLEQGILKIPSGAVVTARGKRYAARSDFALGDPWAQAPAYGDREHREKFERLARCLAPQSVSWADRVPQLTGRLLHLEEEPSVSALTAALNPADSSVAARG